MFYLCFLYNFLHSIVASLELQYPLFASRKRTESHNSEWTLNCSLSPVHYFASVYGLLQQWPNAFFPSGQVLFRATYHLLRKYITEGEMQNLYLKVQNEILPEIWAFSIFFVWIMMFSIIIVLCVYDWKATYITEYVSGAGELELSLSVQFIRVKTLSMVDQVWVLMKCMNAIGLSNGL